MKLIADNYEEDHIHPQHHPHHSHHLHPANMHHRSLPRGPPHANHRPPMDQVSTDVYAHSWTGTYPSSLVSRLGWFTHVCMLQPLLFKLLKLIQFHIYHNHRQSVVVVLSSIKFPPLAPPLSLLLQLHYFLPSRSYSYHRDKEPEGEICQMSVFDRWDLWVRLVYISFISHMSYFFLSDYHIQTAPRTNLMCLCEDSWKRTNCCCNQHKVQKSVLRVLVSQCVFTRRVHACMSVWCSWSYTPESLLVLCT